MRAMTPGRPAERWHPWALEATRVVVALGVSLGVAGLLWSLRPESLTPTIDVVGYPTFVNFNYLPIFWAWRIGIWQIPLVMIAVYALLLRFGPLRRARGNAAEGEPSSAVDAATSEAADQPAGFAIAVAALAVPAGLVCYAVSTLQTLPGGTWTQAGQMAGAAYAAAVGLIAFVVRRVRTSRDSPQGPRYSSVLAGTSAVLAPLVAVGVLVMASHRTIAINPNVSITHWGWLSWWVAVPVALGLLALVATRLKRDADPIVVERIVRTVLLGSVVVLVLTMALPRPWDGSRASTTPRACSVPTC